MPWNGTKTWATGDILPASDLNLYVRDAAAFLHDQGADLASAATITPTTQFHKVTGTTTITSIAILAAGARLLLWFSGALKVANGNNIALNRGDFNALANDLIMLVSDGTNWREIARSGSDVVLYQEATADVTPAGGNVEATPLDAITLASYTFDGVTPFWFEFYAPSYSLAVSSQIGVSLWEDSTDRGRMVVSAQGTGGTALQSAGVARRRHTPAAGAHVFKARAFYSGSTGSAVKAGAGGVAAWLPAYLAMRRA